MSEGLEAIHGAFAFLSEGKQGDGQVAVPTAKARAALDLLADNTPETLQDVNLRGLSKDLFEWAGGSNANRPLIQAVQDALTTPGKYSHAVELIAYASACASLLEPDRLARIIRKGMEVETSFAPAKYTLQLAHRMRPIFSQYPAERQEKLLLSLWIESHKGRWWDLTDGQGANNQAVDTGDTYTKAELQEAFIDMDLSWNPHIAQQVSRLRRNNALLEAVEEYNTDLQHGKVVDPDFAVLTSHIPWLSPDERPESPVGGLLDYLNNLISLLELKLPKAPKKFSDLFPDIQLYGQSLVFPFPMNVMRTDNTELLPGVRLEIVKNAAQLAENRTYMGNCTWSYKKRMEAGKYVLYRVHDGADIYNASMIVPAQGNSWRIDSVLGRHNRNNVPASVRTALQQLAGSLDTAEHKSDLERREQVAAIHKQSKKYKHSL